MNRILTQLKLVGLLEHTNLILLNIAFRSLKIFPHNLKLLRKILNSIANFFRNRTLWFVLNFGLDRLFELWLFNFWGINYRRSYLMVNFLRLLSQLDLERISFALKFAQKSLVSIVFLDQLVDHAAGRVVLVERVS